MSAPHLKLVPPPDPAEKRRTTAVEKALNAWGSDAPDWVMALARAADRLSANTVARQISYSSAVVSNVLARKYSGDLTKVEAAVRGALLGDEVDCPVLGELRRDRCLAEQKKDFLGTSAVRTRLFHACRNGCVHSLIKTKGGGDE